MPNTNQNNDYNIDGVEEFTEASSSAAKKKPPTRKRGLFKRGDDDQLILTPGQARSINKGNKIISSNINTLLDEIHVMTHGISRTDKIDALRKDFESLLTNEIDSITKSTEGDTTSFLTKLLSENRKYGSQSIKDLEKSLTYENAELQGFLEEQYRNRLIKQADLHEIASQLTELKQAITITRDAILSADVIDGHMSRNLVINNTSTEDDRQDYVRIVESVEEKFGLQEKLKEYIVPRSLEYGEYYSYTVPYAKLFEDFAREKQDQHFMAYRESAVEGRTLKEILSKEERAEVDTLITESVKESPIYEEFRNEDPIRYSTSNIPKEIDAYLDNIIISNDPIPLPVLEEGVDSMREYFTEFVESTGMMSEANKPSYSFQNVMKEVDGGVHIDPNWNHKNNNYYGNSGSNSTKGNMNFGDIKDVYIKMMSPMNLLPMEIMDEVIGYYYIIEEDITPLAGILTSTMYYDKFDQNRSHSNVLNTIAETIVRAFDKKFLVKNMKFKRLIVEAITYYKLHNKRIRFQFIPKEYIDSFKVNRDEHGRGVSILQDSLFYAKLFLMHLLFKMMTIILNSNDTKINYVKQAGK